MNRQTHDVEQRSPEWYALRCGIVTASAVGQLITNDTPDPTTVDCGTCSALAGSPCLNMAKGRTGAPIKTIHAERAAFAASLRPEVSVADDKGSRDLTALLVSERIAGWTEDTYVSHDMWRGIDCEPIARDIYSGHYQQAEEVGFMTLEQDGWTLGYSPDGVVGTDGLVEIKAPRAKTHLAYVLADEVPPYYMAQLQAGLLVSGRAYIDFVSFCGGLPLFVKRVFPDPAWHAVIAAAVAKFEETAAEMVAEFRAKTKHMPATERVNPNIVELKLA